MSRIYFAYRVKYLSTIPAGVCTLSPAADAPPLTPHQTMMKNTNVKIAAIYAPGMAIFGTCLLDLTSTAWELGINLTGADIRKAWPAKYTGGVWIEGDYADKHYSITGDIDN